MLSSISLQHSALIQPKTSLRKDPTTGRLKVAPTPPTKNTSLTDAYTEANHVRAWSVEIFWAVQEDVNRIDLVKTFPTSSANSCPMCRTSIVRSELRPAKLPECFVYLNSGVHLSKAVIINNPLLRGIMHHPNRWFEKIMYPPRRLFCQTNLGNSKFGFQY